MLFTRDWLTPECIAAAEGKPPRARSIAMFRNRFLDRVLARAHPAFPALFYGPVAVLAFVYARTLIGTATLLVATTAGWIGFSLFEYLLHRFVFHRTFPDTEQGRIDKFLTHGYHHAYPEDRDRLVLPPIESVPLAVLIAAAEVALLGRGVGLATFAGTTLGYIAYDEIHYLLHNRNPRTAIGRFLRRYHLLHHHAPELARFGVSSPFWDLVFGTFGRVGRGARDLSRRRQSP